MRTYLPLYALVCPLLVFAACGGDPSGNASSGGAGGGGGGASSASATTSTSTSASSTASTSSSTGQGGGSAGFALPMLSLNLHCFRLDGTVYKTNAERFAAIASLAASRDVAVLALQEACERPGESAIGELRAALEKATSAPWSQTWAFAHVAWEGTPDQADEGVGLLVKGSLSDPRDLTLAVQGSLRRIAVSATLPPELSGARVTSVHFEVFEEAARTGQAREVAVAALVDTDPSFSAIVAGDFNDVEGSATHAAFPLLGYLAADAGLDPAGIDHVMIHRATNLRAAATEKVFLGAEAVSDHPGIFVRFEPAVGDIVSPTRITAKYDPGANHFIALRGDTAPLSWSLGFPLHRTSAAEHTFVTTELQGDFAFKVLVDDITWQTGSNVAGKAGTNQVVTPAF